MFHQIMVPLDGSELAERAVPCAERIAVLSGAVLHLVRVIEPPVRATWVPGPVFVAVRAYDDPVERVADEVRSYLSQVRARCSAAGAAVVVAYPVGTYGAQTALMSYEHAAAIDLVVMCSHGRGGVARFALGSVATHMVRHGAAPLLLLRPATAALGHRAIVPLDGSPASEEALPIAVELGGTIVQEMTLLRVVGRPDEAPAAQYYLDTMRQRLCRQSPGPVCGTRVVQGDPAQVIVAEAGTDALVVMATHGRSALTRWALGSVADRVARQGAAPVLLVRARPSGPTTTRNGSSTA